MGLFNRKTETRKGAEEDPAWSDTQPSDFEQSSPAQAFAHVPAPKPDGGKAKRPVGRANHTALLTLTIVGSFGVGFAAWKWMHRTPRPVAAILPVVKKAPAARKESATLKPILPAAPASAATPPVDPLDVARQMFLTASQNAVHVASVRPVQKDLYVVAYVVGDKSGQAWVDLTQKVVFIGSAVSASGSVLTPASTVVAMGATQDGVTPDASAGTSSLPAPIEVMLRDHGAGFWEGSPKAPPAWIFVDPDSQMSLAFYQRVRPLIDSGRLRVFWIPVGLQDAQSMPRAAYILAQVGQARALRDNFAHYSTSMRGGGAPANIITIEMRHRILQNNSLLTDLGQMLVPAAVICGKSGMQTLYGPMAIDNIVEAEHCPETVTALAAK